MATTPSEAAAAAAPVLQGSILYIEDEPTNFAVVEALLSRHAQVRLLHAQTGHDGVALARSQRPEVVLLDMHLPDISGIEVVRMLSEEIAAGQFRVLLLTADRLNIDVLKAMSLGAAEYLMKPVRVQELDAAIARALAFKTGGKTPAGQKRG